MAVGETTVDDPSWHAADAVTGGDRRDDGIVHVANFDIMFGARQKLDQFHTADSFGGEPHSRSGVRWTRRWRGRDSNVESLKGNWLYPDMDPTVGPWRR